MSLKKDYIEKVLPTIQKDLGIKNVNAVPKIEKVIVQMGIGSHVTSGNKDYSELENALTLIAGQKPLLSLSKKAVSNFKLREDMPVGLKVTLRGERMFDFLEKLIHVVLPRIRDFQGIKSKSFDSEGNYNLGIKEHTIFPEVPQDDVVKTHGLQITIKTTAKSTEEGKLLLTQLGFPFTK